VPDTGNIYCEKKYDMNYSEQIILMYISKNEYTNQDKIAKNFMADKGTIAKTVKNLEKKELIIRKENPNNKRENIVSLSQKGKNIISYLNELLLEWREIIFKDFSGDEINQFISLKEKMITNIINKMGIED
jgi:DNA-binding MarR family transcriptional regulator